MSDQAQLSERARLASDAMHLAKEAAAIAYVSYRGPSLLTTTADDLGHWEVPGFCRITPKGDCPVATSSSGSSENIIAAARTIRTSASMVDDEAASGPERLLPRKPLQALRPDQNRLLMPADRNSRGGVLPATRDPALKSSWTSRPMT